jgi:hypothetical protein
MLIEERLPYRLAILYSGRHQYQVAQDAGLSEHQLSMFLHGRLNLKSDQLTRLQAALGMRGAVDAPTEIVVHEKARQVG